MVGASCAWLADKDTLARPEGGVRVWPRWQRRSRCSRSTTAMRACRLGFTPASLLRRSATRGSSGSTSLWPSCSAPARSCSRPAPAPRCWSATRSRPARSRSRSLTPAISSADSSRSSATVGPFSWARSSARTASGAISSSRAPDARRSRVAATDAPRLAPSCASTSSARRWRRWAYPPRVPSPSRRRVRASFARRCCRARSSRAWRRATSAWARSSSSQRAAIERRWSP